jgi:hypothetical protein
MVIPASCLIVLLAPSQPSQAAGRQRGPAGFHRAVEHVAVGVVLEHGLAVKAQTAIAIRQASG